MERPSLATAAGVVSGIVGLLALIGLIDTTLVVVAASLVVLRASSAARGGGSLADAIAVVLPLAALVAVAADRAGSASLDAIRGANAVLGPAASTQPAALAAATVLASLAVLLTTRIFPREPEGRGLSLAAAALTVLAVATAAAGPSVDRAAALPLWGLTAVIGASLLLLFQRVARHPRASHLGALLAGMSLLLAVVA